MEISVSEAAALLGRSARTVRAQVARGELPGVKRGGQWFVDKAALPLTEAQRARLQGKAQGLRDALEDALPARLAHSSAERRRGLADLDAFRLGAALLAELRAARAVAGVDLPRVVATLETALLDVAEASAQYDREARRAALIRARRGLGHVGGRGHLAGGAEAPQVTSPNATLPPSPARSVGEGASPQARQVRVSPRRDRPRPWPTRRHT